MGVGGRAFAGPAFVVGMPRSGTTLLSAMLDAHSQVAITPELHYFTQHWRMCDEAVRAGDTDVPRLIDQLLATDEFADLRLDGAEVVRVRRLAANAATHRDVYSAFLRVYADRSGKAVSGEKTPPYVLRIPLLRRIFPEARFVCIVRDPRAVSLSWQDAGWRGGPLFHALQWRRYLRAALRAEALLGDAFLLVRYEDLVRRPREVLERCCAVLGVEFEDQMLSFHTAGNRNFDPEREPWKRKATMAVDAGNADKWRTDLSPSATRAIELTLSRAMAAQGYPATGQRVAPDQVWGVVQESMLDLPRTLRVIGRQRWAWRGKGLGWLA